MKIVLLGASGFIGSHLVPRLTRDGRQCLLVTRRPGRCRELTVGPGVTEKALDPYDADALAGALTGADAAINLVGILNEKGRDGSGFERAHVELVEKLVEACGQAGVRRILHVSALGVEDGESHYLKSKARAEQVLRQAQHVDETLFRPAVVFGPGDSFFNRFAGLLKISPVLPLACADAPMQPVSVDNVVEAMARSLEDRSTVGRGYPLVGPRVWTLGELVRWTAETLGLKRTIVPLPDPVSRMQAAVMDFVPGKPFSTDNYRSLQTPSVSERNGLDHFDIQPTPVEAVVPAYLNGSLKQQRLAAYRRGARR